MVSHNYHPRNSKQKQCRQPVRPLELSFGAMKDAYWSKLCHSGNPSNLVTSRRPRSLDVHYVTNVLGRQVHPATLKRSASHYPLYIRRTIENLGLNPGVRCVASTVLSMSEFKRPSAVVTNYWSGFLPQSDVRTYRTLAKVFWSGWGFCRQVNTVYTFDWHGVLICVLYVIVKLIFSWPSIRPSYILRDGRTIWGSAS